MGLKSVLEFSFIRSIDILVFMCWIYVLLLVGLEFGKGILFIGLYIFNRCYWCLFF